MHQHPWRTTRPEMKSSNHLWWAPLIRRHPKIKHHVQFNQLCLFESKMRLSLNPPNSAFNSCERFLGSATSSGWFFPSIQRVGQHSEFETVSCDTSSIKISVCFNLCSFSCQVCLKASQRTVSRTAIEFWLSWWFPVTKWNLFRTESFSKWVLYKYCFILTSAWF